MNCNEIKLICIDMDGTLLNKYGEVSYYDKIALLEARKRNINIALTTGRIFQSAKYYSNLIGIDGYVIACNGAYINNDYNTSPLLEEGIPKCTVFLILNILKKYNLTVHFNGYDTLLRDSPLSPDHIYFKMNNSLNEKNKVKIVINKNLTELLANYDKNILKIVIRTDTDINNLLLAKEELQSKFKTELNIVRSETNIVEIMNGKVSKGNAVSYLAKFLGIRQKHIMCIGNGENDLSMIKYANFGIAVSNAIDILKNEADYITESNSDNGVGKVINKFILKGGCSKL